MDKLWVQIALWAVAGVNGLGVLWLAASWVAARRDDWKRGIRRAQRREDTARRRRMRDYERHAMKGRLDA